MKTWLIKPYAHRDQTWDQRIFNYHLSRARRIVENAFGILAKRFGCLLGTMRQAPETVAIIMRAAVCLHNLRRIKCPRISPEIIDHKDTDHNVHLGFWRRIANMQDIEQHIRGSADEKRARKFPYKGHPYIPKTKRLKLFVFCMNGMCVYECKVFK